MSSRIVLSAGGTGGHLFPAQSLASELSDCQLLFIATGLSQNPRFDRTKYAYVDVASGTITLKKLLSSSLSIAKGIFQSIRALRAFKPDLVIGFGSYHTFPVVVAARLLGIPIVLHEANSVPGKVNRILSPYAAWSGVFFPDAAKYLKGEVQKTDLPLRKQFLASFRPQKDAAIRHYGLEGNRQTVLVFGGSLGAKKVNELAAKSICSLSNVQVLHFTGSKEASSEVAALYKEANIPAVVREFEQEMQYAWAAADVCIARSGASTIAEAITCNVPSIFIPYPQAADNHQEKNAEYLAKTLNAAVYYREESLHASTLTGAIESLLAQDMQRTLKTALAAANTSLDAVRFSDLIRTFLGEKR